MTPRDILPFLAFTPITFGVIAFSRFGFRDSRKPEGIERRLWEFGLAGITLAGLILWFGEPNFGSWRQFGWLAQALFNVGVLVTLEIHWAGSRPTEAKEPQAS